MFQWFRTKALESQSVYSDEIVHSAGTLNGTEKNNGKDEKDSKCCSNGSHGKVVKGNLRFFVSKVMSATDEIAHSVGNLNATDENNGKSEKNNKECSNGSDGKNCESRCECPFCRQSKCYR